MNLKNEAAKIAYAGTNVQILKPVWIVKDVYGDYWGIAGTEESAWENARPNLAGEIDDIKSCGDYYCAQYYITEK